MRKVNDEEALKGSTAMFRRRKRKNSGASRSQPDSHPSTSAPTPATPFPVTNVHQKTKISPLLTDAFKKAIERAADWPRKDIASDGKIKPMMFFVHEDGTMKAVYLSLKDEYQKESLILKIREKVHAEHAFAVIYMTEMDTEKHTVVLCGVSPGIKASVYVDYCFDPESTITSQTINWLNQSFHDTLIDGIFDTDS